MNCKENKNYSYGLKYDQFSNQKLPIGIKESFNFKYPKSWKNKSTEELNEVNISCYSEIEKLSNFNSFFFKNLNFNDKLIKIIEPDIFNDLKFNFKIKDPFFKIDSVSYFCGILAMNKKFKIAFFKDRSIYSHDSGGDEGCKMNYINLVSLDKKNEIIDKMTICISINCLYDSSERFFYIDEDLNIFLKDFSFGEIETTFLGELKIKINEQGVFKEQI